MKIVEFTRHNAPFVSGEKAAFDPLTAERMRKRGVGRIVGSVDDKGQLVLHAEAEVVPEVSDAGDGDPAAPAGSAPAGRRAARA